MHSPIVRAGRRMYDLLITLLLWAYFTGGFLLFFSPFYAAAAMFSSDRETAFQRLNRRFYLGFFFLLRRCVPRCRWHLQDAVHTVRSSVVVCNHRSYLDPLLLISLFEKHKTIVKERFFHIPVFGWMISQAGYLPSGTRGTLSDILLEQMEKMGEFLDRGGVLFVFPEGTRRRSDRVGPMNKGAFTIAARYRVPVEVLWISNTDRLFRPGRFLFQTANRADITVRSLGRVRPEDVPDGYTPGRIRAEVAALYERAADNRLQ